MRPVIRLDHNHHNTATPQPHHNHFNHFNTQQHTTQGRFLFNSTFRLSLVVRWCGCG